MCGNVSQVGIFKSEDIILFTADLSTLKLTAKSEPFLACPSPSYKQIDNWFSHNLRTEYLFLLRSSVTLELLQPIVYNHAGAKENNYQWPPHM